MSGCGWAGCDAAVARAIEGGRIMAGASGQLRAENQDAAGSSPAVSFLGLMARVSRYFDLQYVKCASRHSSHDPSPTVISPKMSVCVSRVRAYREVYGPQVP